MNQYVIGTSHLSKINSYHQLPLGRAERRRPVYYQKKSCKSVHRVKQLEPRLIFVVQRPTHRGLRRKVFVPRLYPCERKAGAFQNKSV